MKFLTIALSLSMLACTTLAIKRNAVPERFIHKGEDSLKHLYECDRELFLDTLEAIFLYDTRVVEHSPWLLNQFNWALQTGAIDVDTILEHFGTPEPIIEESECHELVQD